MNDRAQQSTKQDVDSGYDCCYWVVVLVTHGAGSFVSAPHDPRPVTRSDPRPLTESVNRQLVSSARVSGRPTGFFPGWFVSQTTGWMTMSKAGRGGLYKTADGGHTWTLQLSLPYPKLFQRDMSFLDENVGFVVAGTIANGNVVPVLYATIDGGQHWEARNLPGGGAMTGGVDFVSESRGWVLVEYSSAPAMLYSTTDGGRTWASLGTGGRLAGVDPKDHLEGVRFDDSNQGWIAGWKSGGLNGASPQYYRTGDGGNTWTAEPLPVAATGAGTSAPLYVDTPQRQVDGSLVGGVTQLIAGRPGVQVFSTAGGTGTWTLVLDVQSPPGQTTPTWSVADGRVVTTLGQSIQLSSGTVGSAVQQTRLPPGTVAIQLVSAAEGFAMVLVSRTSNSFTLYSTADGGKSWTERGPLVAP